VRSVEDRGMSGAELWGKGRIDNSWLMGKGKIARGDWDRFSSVRQIRVNHLRS